MFRRVMAKVWDKKKQEFIPVYGKFHCWGQTYDEFESGPGNLTVAIIELEDGKVVVARPEDVVFMKEEA